MNIWTDFRVLDRVMYKIVLENLKDCIKASRCAHGEHNYKVNLNTVQHIVENPSKISFIYL